ncbi:MAG: D-glycero-beta-D-manno-heptose-1,7-bisphosphate 7-phosphatase [Acidobacteria bacterium]|nr:D-glycero-beta-D-manno-heptose-1,7-bisphosphate 7-phosphatase [Acidobacteriota bacterium]
MMDIPEQIKLIIFDADGTLRRTTVAGKPCPHAPGEWELMPKVKEALSGVNWRERKLALGVASNQDQVAYGHLSRRMAYQLLEDMIVAATGCDPASVTIRFCPHALEDDCGCHKPRPGMLIEIMHSRDVAPAETMFVGDSESDCEAARRASVSFAWAKNFFGWE